MTINANDDYEKLAKLLYPSIEASGNVYYGQTRKLLMDEVLGKNDLGFESHIDSIRVEDDTEHGWHYETYFVWKLGPFKGSVKVGDLESFPLGYAKYKLVFNERTVDNVTSAGTFPTYKQDCACEFDSIVYTTTDPIDFSKQWDGKEFYIDDSGSDKYLLVALVDLHKDFDYNQLEELEKTPLCFTAINGGVGVAINIVGSLEASYEYLKVTHDSPGEWLPYTMGDPISVSTHIDLDHGTIFNEKLYFRGHRSSQSESNYISISVNKDSSYDAVDVSGNICSLLDEHDFCSIKDLSSKYTSNGYSIGNYTFLNLFKDCGIDSAHNLLLPATVSAIRSYCRSFYNCTDLVTPPILQMSIANISSCEQMFYNCPSLSRSPELYASKLSQYCYKDIFYGCSNLKCIVIHAKDVSSLNCLENWAYNVSPNGIIYCEIDSMSSLAPSGWLIDNIRKDEPLTLLSVYGPTSICDENPSNSYLFRLNYSGEWQPINGTTVELGKGDSIELKTSLPSGTWFWKHIDMWESDDTVGRVAAYGNVGSAIDSENYTNLDFIGDNGLQSMFADDDILIRCPKISANSCGTECCEEMFYGCIRLLVPPILQVPTLGISCYKSMFNGCTSLISTPSLYSTVLNSNCYESMFEGCTNLKEASPLKATTLFDNCYKNMFNGCASLNKAVCLAKDASAVDCTADWLSGCSSTGTIFYNRLSNLIADSDSGIPSGWTAIDLYEKITDGENNHEEPQVYNPKYLTVFGADSDQNGKGKLDGDGNYETSFDERGTHQMNSYNPDGSYNQEIWGYKSFNSPVQFRNGIYGEHSGIIAHDLDLVQNATAKHGVKLATQCLTDDGLHIEKCAAIGLGCEKDSLGNVKTAINLDADDINIKCIKLPSVNYNQSTDTTEVPISGIINISLKSKLDLTPLCFTNVNNEPSTVTLTLQGSLDRCTYYTSIDCINWVSYDIGNTITLNSKGHKVYFKGSRSTQSVNNYLHFSMTGNIEASGDVTSMLYGETGSTVYDLTSANSYTFYMMFKGCTSLLKAPKLPATTLAESCYNQMFENCTNLIKAPDLPATTLTNYCYSYMFKGCTSLLESPKLPATTLAQYCYSNMFYGCTKLSVIHCNAINMTAWASVDSWVTNVSSSGIFYKNNSANWNQGVSGIPTGWQEYVYSTQPTQLCFTNVNNGPSTVALKMYGTVTNADYEVSTDGINWSSYTIDDIITLNNRGDKVYFKGSRDQQNTSKYLYFKMSGRFEASGDITSMLYGLTGSTVYNLSGTTWQNAFCNMFENCTSLITAPELPSTQLADSCYYKMFKGCTNLIKAPELPATELAKHCYSYMFYDCTNLKVAPELPATTLVQSCYKSMFNGCKLLVSSPELPAAELDTDCYNSMFYRCNSLKTIFCNADNLTSGPTGNASSMLVSTSPGGIAYLKAGFNDSDNIIPTSWTIRNTYVSMETFSSSMTINSGNTVSYGCYIDDTGYVSLDGYSSSGHVTRVADIYPTIYDENNQLSNRTVDEKLLDKRYKFKLLNGYYGYESSSLISFLAMRIE